MSIAALAAAWPRRGARDGRWLWLGFLILAFLLWWGRDFWPYLVSYPKGWSLPLARYVSAAIKWLVEDFTVATRAIAFLLQIPLDFFYGIFAKGFGGSPEAPTIPPLSWLGIVLAAALIGQAYGGRRLALIGGACFLFIAVFGQWQSAMLSLALIAFAVPLCVALGLGLGILGYRHRRFEAWILRPVLDLMQTMPAFAYLVPILIFFGSGPVPALVATVIFSVPPMVRNTILALALVPEETRSFADMAGCTRRQKLWRVMLPTARRQLMVGVNQTIMMCLNMVIIASMIGAGGLGYDVLLALRALNLGRGLEAGLAIVALAVALDRLSQAAAQERRDLLPPETPFNRRHPYLLLGLALLSATTLAGLVHPAFARIPDWLVISTGDVFGNFVKWINVNFYDYIDAVKTWLLLNLLKPTKLFMLELPWLAVIAGIGLLGYRLGGWRLALLGPVLMGLVLIVGLWDKGMISVYLCFVSGVIAILIGVPLGFAAARSESIDRALRLLVDTLQTLPTFVYLIPVVMLFGVGDVAAMIAIIAYAVAPAIRYTALGLRQVDPRMIEAARAMGCTERQRLWRVQFPLALPQMLLGLNQTILLAISMLVFTSLVGSSDLGQDVYTALAKADPGRGLVAGFAIAFLGIVMDRLAAAAAKRTRERFGLDALPNE